MRNPLFHKQGCQLLRVGNLILLCLVLIAACRETSTKEDPKIFKAVLREYFDGMKTKDLKKMNEVTTPDFVLFEDGKVWNNDNVIQVFKSLKSFQGDWEFDSMRVNMDTRSGDIRYFNHGNFIVNDTQKVSYNWLESATFRKIDGKWKMNFLHSTLVR